MSRITTIIKQSLDAQQAPSPFSFLRTEAPVNLDNVFINARQKYTYEIGKEIADHMEQNGIAYAHITTASKNGPCVRPIIKLQNFRKGNPQLKEVKNGHPDLSQHLYNGYYVVNPRVLATA